MMIRASFLYSKGGFCVGFEVFGHSGFAESGLDIVCSAVSCAVQMCCNGITEIVKADAQIFVDPDKISLRVEKFDEKVQVLLESLRMQIGLLEKDYGENISLLLLEV